MFDRRYEIEGVLELLSPLHIGSGESKVIAGVGGQTGSKQPAPEVALIVRDHLRRPYLPPTALKGMLRRLGEALVPDFVTELFGEIKHSETKTGVMGALLVRGALLEGEAPDASGYPYASAAAKELGRGVFVAAHTAINPMSGTADEHKLFFQEMAAPGAKFGLRLILIAEANGGRRRLDVLTKILGALSIENGIVCGRGKADGSGALQLIEKSLKVFKRDIDPNGVLGKEEIRVELPKAPETAEPVIRWEGVFHCKGPFLSLDSSWDPEREKQGLPEKDQQNIPQLSYQHGANEKPLELGSQVAGVLRARARWIAGLQALKEGLDPRGVDPTAGDDEAGKKALKERVVKTRKDVGRLGLTPVERLFGVSGFAGLLRIEKMKFSGGKEFDISSVKLDHFSGAPIDKALFKTRAMTGVQLELSLSLHARKDAEPNKQTEAAAPAKEDEDLFKELVKGLEDKGNVLMLGHGANKGFGWFEYKGSGEHGGR